MKLRFVLIGLSILTMLACFAVCKNGKVAFIGKDDSTKANPLNLKRMNNTVKNMEGFEIQKTEQEWLEQLGPEAYQVLRKKGTERPFSSEYELLWDSGTYVCKGCGLELFQSDTKFDAGCGWPSFFKPIASDRIKEIVDLSHNMVRTEVVCGRCGGHLGHVFNDGYNQPTGLRYCINGISLGFEKKK